MDGAVVFGGGDDLRTNADMTVFNRRIVNKQETFIPTPVYGVAWNQKYKTQLTDKGLVGAQEFSVRIPLTATAGVPGASKAYIAPQDYPSASPDEYFTLQPGDWIVKGLFTSDLQAAIENNPNACQVRSAVDNRDPRASASLQHWRVMG